MNTEELKKLEEEHKALEALEAALDKQGPHIEGYGWKAYPPYRTIKLEDLTKNRIERRIMKEKQVLESVFAFNVGMFKVRVWRHETPEHPYDNTDITDRLQLKGMRDMWLIADYIAQMDRVNAVEVTLDGNGIVLYNDWP